MANITAWIGALSVIVTTALTILNAVWSNDIQRTEQSLKEKASQLDHQRFQLEVLSAALAESKDRIDRYKFVREQLFEQLVGGKDQSHRTLAINMVYLALKPEEATKLFDGFQRSDDKQAQAIGNLGSDLVGVSSLVAQINAPERDVRRAALATLIRNNKSDSRALELVISLLEPPSLDKLSAEGRINALTFLYEADPKGWTPDLAKRASNAIANINARRNTGVAVGQDTQNLLDKVSIQLDKLPKK